jgi:ADP-ribosylglycohydrolase
VIPSLPDSAVRDRLQSLVECSDSLFQVSQQYGSTGHVANVVPLAIYAAQLIGQNSIESVLGETISCGGDTDTIAAIAGQIAGCFLGCDLVPKTEINRIAGVREIQSIVEEFAEWVELRG